MSKLLPMPLKQWDQYLIATSLLALVALAWAYLLVLDSNMQSMPNMVSGIHPWTPADFVMMFLMWAVMMFAMMVPSAMRSVLIFARISPTEEHRDLLVTPAFAFGYIVIWILFSILATTLQWVLEMAALLSPMMVVTSGSLGAAFLIAAGIYQLTPLKNSCLRHCQSPAMFMAAHYKKGMRGAFQLGSTHGVYCLGCCWLLMGLLFVGGVMNLIWILAISLFVLAEKLLPPKIRSTSITSLIMIAVGSVYLLESTLG
ncbi:MAG: DUF2182 domain-containing protein [Acidiferrobacterales bacterium]